MDIKISLLVANSRVDMSTLKHPFRATLLNPSCCSCMQHQIHRWRWMQWKPNAARQTDLFNVHWTLKISFIMSRLFSLATNNLIFLTSLSLSLYECFHFTFVFFFFRFFFLVSLTHIPLSFVLVAVLNSAHAFHFMTYEIFIIPKIYMRVLSFFVWLRLLFMAIGGTNRNKNTPNKDNNEILQ